MPGIGSRGGLGPTKYPSRFTTSAGYNQTKHTQPELKVFDNVSGAEGDSDAIYVGTCEDFAVWTFGDAGDVDIYATINPLAGWVKVKDAMGNNEYWGPSGNLYNWIKIDVESAANLTVYVHRKYATY